MLVDKASGPEDAVVLQQELCETGALINSKPMKQSHAEAMIAILAMIWSNVAKNDLIALGAVIIGLFFVMNAILSTFTEHGGRE